MAQRQTEQQTRDVFNILNRLSDEDLDAMLDAGGVVPMKDRGMKLHQAVIRWFMGSVPSLTELVRCLEGCPQRRV